MAIIASTNGNGTEYAPVPQGTHIAICNMVVDLGDHKTDYQGVQSVKRQVYIRWEIPAERMTGERDGPMNIGRTYTLSLHEKAGLRRDLEAWRGRKFTDEELKGFDVSKLLQAPAMLTVTHDIKQDGSVRGKVAGISGLPKGTTRPGKPENTPILFDDDTQDDLDRLPDWIKKKLDERIVKPVARSTVGGAQVDEDLDDDIPFISCNPCHEYRVF